MDSPDGFPVAFELDPGAPASEDKRLIETANSMPLLYVNLGTTALIYVILIAFIVIPVFVVGSVFSWGPTQAFVEKG